MGHPDYHGRVIGLAKVIDESPYSDGSTALEILNWRKADDGYLQTLWRIIPLIHYDAVTHASDIPVPFQDDGCLGIGYVSMEGEIPELLFLTKSGVYRYAPWIPAGVNGGLVEQYFYEGNNNQKHVRPQGRLLFPPQIEVMGNRIYFTWGDGASAWVWDGDRVRPFGYTSKPASVDAQGPQVLEGDEQASPNKGGFSVKGRVGTTDESFVSDTGTLTVVGGVDNGEWHYYVVLEGVDGNYSATSERGGVVTMRMALADPSGDEALYPQDLLRRFRVFIPRAPPHTAARVILRTANLRRLPAGDDGSPRFLHRMIGDVADEWIDDIPDGELGPVWEDRAEVPLGFYLLKSFGGSLFWGRTDAYPSRIWWSEQTNAIGPTPESAMAGHWRDIYPNTGALTGWHEVQFGSDASQAALLVFKEKACHFLTGAYAGWQVGTLHRSAGLAGPNLIQTVADGSVIWYGNRTFWRLTRDGQITDIGVTIRKRLLRVNQAMVKMGDSFIDPTNNEAVFSLPMDSSVKNDYQFVWDHEDGGWRAQDHMSIAASCLIPDSDIVLVAGEYRDEPNVFVWQRGTPTVTTPANGYTFYGAGGSYFQTGWVSMSGQSDIHSAFQINELIVTAKESYDGTATLETFSNWNPSDNTGGFDQVSLTYDHPEDDEIAHVGNEDDAVFDEAVYRDRRTFTVKVPLEIPSAEVCSLKLTVGTAQWCSLINMCLYGPKLSGPGSRTPTVAEYKETILD